MVKSESYYKDGEDHYYNEDFINALTSFQKHYEIYEDNDSLNYIGCCYMQINELDRAMSIFKELINKCISWSRPVFNLGRVYLKLGDYPKMLECFNKALDIDPDEEEIYYYFGVYFYKINELDKAISYYKRSLALNNSQPEAHLNLGLCYSKLGKYMQAMEEFEIALNLDDNYIDALFNMAMLSIAMKEYKKATNTLLKLHYLQPDNIENIIDMVNCYLKINDLGNAEKWIKEILIKDSNNKEASKLQKVLTVKRRIG